MTGKRLEFREGRMTLGGEPFYIASGDMHYFRFFKGGWERRLRLMKDFGLTCVQTYVPWNLHEREKGQFCFEDHLDLAGFIRLCGSMGLYVLLRPSPYMCAEWDLGGLPYWLLKDRRIQLRTSDPIYMGHLRDYYTRLMQEVVPLQSTSGGPIIAMAVENEYGSFGNDTAYLQQVADLMRSLGVDVPLYTANGATERHFINGSLSSLWTGVDALGVRAEEAALVKAFQGEDKPLLVCEEWAGRAQQWGGVFFRQTTESAVQHYREGLQAGFMINFYMFCGGTNFGFMNGANYGLFRKDTPGAKHRYIPFTTSYDVDAPVSEAGVPTEKYYALKKVLAEYRGTPYEETPYEYRAQAPGRIKLEKAAALFDNLEAVCEKKVTRANVCSMEELDQDYGFILYQTFVPYTDDGQRVLRMKGFGDRATVYGNDRYLGSCMRDREDLVRFAIPKEGLHLSILVENMGRVCYGYPLLFDRKGIERCVHFDVLDAKTGRPTHNFFMQTGWTIYTLPLRDLTGVSYGERPKENLPGFYRGHFTAEAGVDTFLRLPGWNKGCVFINGFHLGRYWKIGPQETLYVPGELLSSENTIEIFELYGANEDRSVEFIDHPLLDALLENAEVVLEKE